MGERDFRYVEYKDLEYKRGNTIAEELVGLLVSMVIYGLIYWVLRSVSL